MTQIQSRTKSDYIALMIEESASIATFLETLSPAGWDVDSLCQGWKVRHVISHMAVGHTMNLLPFIGAVIAARSVPRASHRLALRFGDTHPPERIIAAFRAGTAGPPQGPAARVAPPELFVDHLVHHQDIRRPLGERREIPAERLGAALEILPTLGGLFGAKSRLRGLRLVAEDTGHRLGEGPEVVGTAEAIIMCGAGRPAPLPELSGDGAVILGRRLGISPPGTV